LGGKFCTDHTCMKHSCFRQRNEFQDRFCGSHTSTCWNRDCEAVLDEPEQKELCFSCEVKELRRLFPPNLVHLLLKLNWISNTGCRYFTPMWKKDHMEFLRRLAEVFPNIGSSLPELTRLMQATQRRCWDNIDEDDWEEFYENEDEEFELLERYGFDIKDGFDVEKSLNALLDATEQLVRGSNTRARVQTAALQARSVQSHIAAAENRRKRAWNQYHDAFAKTASAEFLERIGDLPLFIRSDKHALMALWSDVGLPTSGTALAHEHQHAFDVLASSNDADVEAVRKRLRESTTTWRTTTADTPFLIEALEDGRLSRAEVMHRSVLLEGFPAEEHPEFHDLFITASHSRIRNVVDTFQRYDSTERATVIRLLVRCFLGQEDLDLVGLELGLYQL
jgi:hypothetical protein